MKPWPNGARAILHVDMDAFYASVEIREQPELKGRPVIVGGPKDARGVVSAASYEARRYGVHSAMPLVRAARLCPQGVFLPVRMELYAQVSRAVFAIFKDYSPLVEPLSVDEAFLDLTGCERLFGGPVAAATQLRARIREEIQLTASVGVAPNKFVAKIASDLRKPDALVVAHPEGLEEFLAPLDVRRMWGVGPKGAAALTRMGMHTFRDLAQASDRALKKAFGSNGPRLRDLARGRDARAVVTARGPKSVGHETTFSQNLTDRAELRAVLIALVDKVAARLRSHGLKGRKVTLKARYEPFRTVSRQCTLAAPTWTTRPLLDAADALFTEEVAKNREPVRLLGISVAGFSSQESLFSAATPDDSAVDEAVDALRARFGVTAVRRGSVFNNRLRSSRENDPENQTDEAIGKPKEPL